VYNKLAKDGSQVKDLKDLSGARVNLDMHGPDFQQHYDVAGKIDQQFGNDVARSKDYIKNPSPKDIPEESIRISPAITV